MTVAEFIETIDLYDYDSVIFTNPDERIYFDIWHFGKGECNRPSWEKYSVDYVAHYPFALEITGRRVTE